MGAPVAGAPGCGLRVRDFLLEEILSHTRSRGQRETDTTSAVLSSVSAGWGLQGCSTHSCGHSPGTDMSLGPATQSSEPDRSLCIYQPVLF